MKVDNRNNLKVEDAAHLERVEALNEIPLVLFTEKITVGLVEDNAQLTRDIRSKLALSAEVEVLFEARNGKTLLAELANGRVPDVLLMDICMPGMDGIEATWQAKQQYPHLKIVMLTVMDDEQKLFEALKAGARGYLLKDAKAHHLLTAIDEVLEGGLPLSPSLAKKVLDYLLGKKPIPKLPIPGEENLTNREQEILEMLVNGMSVKLISDKIIRSDKTVQKHLEHIYEKLHVHSYKELMAKRFGS